MNYTKGEWIVDGTTVSLNGEIGKLIAVAYEPGDHLHITPIAEANAQLISAAPNMLEALKGMVEMFELVSEKVNWGSSFLGAKEIKAMNEAPIRAQKAIKKAEGVK